jgi:hypothetical protein
MGHAQDLLLVATSATSHCHCLLTYCGSTTSSQLAGVVFRGCWGGSWGFSWRYLRVPPIPLGDWDTDDTPHLLPPKCPWQNLPQQPRKPGHQTVGGGCGPGVRAGAPPPRLAAHRHPGRPPPGWLGRGDRSREGAAPVSATIFTALKIFGLRAFRGKVSID